MEISPNSETKPRVRRRLIQSTLFPHKSPDNVVCVDEDIEPDVEQEDDEEDNCGSQAKKGRKRKPKAAAQPRAARKLAVNGNEIGGKNTDEEGSPAAVKVDFFVKVSERKKRQQKEQLPVLSPEKVEQVCSPPDVIMNSKSPRKPRRRANTTPKKQQACVTPQKRQMNSNSKNATNGRSLNEDCSDKMLASPPKQIPDLRLEAKMTAEENSRIFAGKQIHPFFSFRKAGKKNPETTSTENKWCDRKESNNDFSPLHVFDKSKAETFSVDWGNWIFSESISARATQDPKDTCSQPINEGLVSCLQFDNFLDAPSSGIECRNIETVREDVKIFFSENSKFVVNLDSERMTSNDRSHQSENSLWTTKYQPNKAIEICGNSESVKFLNEWLQQWREKGSRINKCSTDDNDWVMKDVDLNYCPSDCDSEYSNEENSLKNVLLVTGPVGSGKSAAIYACAKEQGFQVIEVNTSDWRNGALVKQKFGEAVESHWLQCSMASSENPDNKSQPKSTPTKTKSANDVIELIPLSDDEGSKDVCGPAAKPNNSQNGTKTLILFEDVDVTAYEDRGFIATIQQLAETAKRPMILTSNSDDPDLPNNLDRIEVSFKIPSSDELLRLAYTVCAAEKAEIDPCLAERFIDHCHGDIRKTIALLQFWCQGQSQRKDSEVRNTYAPLLFETNAGHHVLPQMIPFGYTSKLSETIDNEITKSTLLTKKDAMLMETIEEEEDENNNTQDINSKKDEMLRIHCFEQEENNGLEFTRRTLQKKYDPVTSYDSEPCWNEDVLNITDELNEETPVETRNSRRKYNAVLSSDSEEECFNEDTCLPSEVPDVSCVPESSYVPETEIENGTMMYSTMCSSGCDYGIEKGPTNTDSEKGPTNTDSEKGPTNTDSETNNRNHGCEEDKVVRDLDLDNHEQVHGEEIGDSHIEPTDSIPRDYQMMDECSRIEFSEKSESVHGFKSAGSTDAVQETWRKLRNCSKELSQYVSVEEKDTLEALRISYGMTNLISEADVLLADCQSLTCDNLKPSMISYEKSHSYSWHDDQLQMASAFAQHGFCVFAKRSFALGSNDKMDLAWEMLAASTNAVSLGKFINRKNSLIRSLGNKKLQSGACSRSILESPICNTIRSIVPLRSQLSLKGYVFHEYLSSLAHISRSESSRLSEAVNNSNQRRKWVARNYLSNGALSLSSEDISLLDEYKCYQKHSSETKSES
ncbi:putative checkpoint protein Rad17/Rad24 [Helianthus debilis subsp. tardiflorus]